MHEAVQSARRFLAAPVWKDFVIGPAGGLANATTDELLDKYIRQSAGSPAHPVGTAAMSAKNASFGVVDPDLQVKEVLGLRIVDASVMVSNLSFFNSYDTLNCFLHVISPSSLLGTHKHLCISLLSVRPI